MSKMKKMLGILLSAVMVISSCIPITTKAAENVTLSFFKGDQQDSYTQCPRYCVYLDGFNVTQSTALNALQVTLYIDGVEKTHNDLRFWKSGDTGRVLLTVPYDILESGVTSCWNLTQEHTIRIKAGTVFKDTYTVENDVMFSMNKNVVTEVTDIPEEPEEGNEVALAYDSGAQAEGDKRYCLYFTGFSAEQLTAIQGLKPTLYIDGVAKSDPNMYFWTTGTGDKALLVVPYDFLESGVTSCFNFTQEHTLWIKAGTVLKDAYSDKDAVCTVANDVKINLKANVITDESASAAKNVTLAIKQMATADTYKRYDVHLDGLDDTKITAYTRVTLYIDGVAKTHNDLGIWPYGDHVLLTVPYDVLESGVTKHADLTSPHTIEIKADSAFGDYTVANNISISVDGDIIKDTSTLTEIAFELLSTSAAQDYYDEGKTSPAKRYLLYLAGITEEQIAAMHQKGAKINLDEERLSTGPYYWNTLENGTAITMILDYSVIEDGVTEAANFADQHMVTIKKGTIIADNYIVGEDLMIQINKYEVAEYVEPDLIEPEVKDEVTTSVSGTELTVGGTGTIKASDLASVTASSITKITIEGPCNIDSHAFVGFTALQEVYFSNTVLTAADDAFSGCASGVKAIFVKDRSLTGGLDNVDTHEYYSFKIFTLGSSYGEDMNNYIYTLATNYYASLPGRAPEDVAYDDIVVAELFTGGGTLQQRVDGIMGRPSITCYYEKWDKTGVVIPPYTDQQLTAENMRKALQDEYWDIVILMQSANDSNNAASFLADTSGQGRADMDTVINFVKANNKNHSGSKYMWIQTWSYNYKLNASSGGYANAVQAEETMRQGIATSMQTVVQQRVDAGALDGIIPAGAAIEYLKNSYLNVEDPNYVKTHENGTYNEGNYSNYFAIQRDTAHASIGLGRFSLGLTAFAYLAGLENSEIQTLAKTYYPLNYEECEVSEKLEIEHSQIFAYLEYDEYTKDCAPQAYSAAIKALADPYMKGTATKIYMTGDANGDDAINALDLIRYKKAQTGAAEIVDAATADINMDGAVDAADLKALRAWFVE